MHPLKRIGLIDDTGRLDKDDLRIFNNFVYYIILDVKPSARMLHPKVENGHADFTFSHGAEGIWNFAPKGICAPKANTIRVLARFLRTPKQIF